MKANKAVPVRAYNESILISGAKVALGLKQELPDTPINHMQGKKIQGLEHPWWEKLLCCLEIW